MSVDRTYFNRMAKALEDISASDALERMAEALDRIADAGAPDLDLALQVAALEGRIAGLELREARRNQRIRELRARQPIFSLPDARFVIECLLEEFGSTD